MTQYILCTLTAVRWKEVEDCKSDSQELISWNFHLCHQQLCKTVGVPWVREWMSESIMMMLWYTYIYIFWLILYNFDTLWWFIVWLIVSFVCYCFYVWVETVNSHNGMNKVIRVAHSKCSKSWLVYSCSDIYLSVSCYVALKSAYILLLEFQYVFHIKFLHTPPGFCFVIIICQKSACLCKSLICKWIFMFLHAQVCSIYSMIMTYLLDCFVEFKNNRATTRQWKGGGGRP